MCITPGAAEIGQTKVCVFARCDGTHLVSYQSTATNRSPGGNLMVINIRGTDLQLVDGPQRTTSLMADITAGLEPLDPFISKSRAAVSYDRGPAVVKYGDFHVIVAQTAEGILSAVCGDEVPENRRPARTPQLEALCDFLVEKGKGFGFLLGCFDGSVTPTHPIVVNYRPPIFDMLRAPGWDGHRGELPRLGHPMLRDFKVTFGVEGLPLPKKVNYSDSVDPSWAPDSVVGFYDNRKDGKNDDYIVGMRTLEQGITGRALAGALI